MHSAYSGFKTPAGLSLNPAFPLSKHWGPPHGPYFSRHDAVADAIDAAERLAKPKKRFDVLLKLPGSSAELLWSSKTYFADRRANRLAGLAQPREQENVEKWA